MNKHNPGSQTVTEQRRREVKAARRDRRKAKRNELIAAKVKPLVLMIGQLRQQVKQLTTEKQLERLVTSEEGRSGQAGPVTDTEDSSSSAR